MNDFSARSDSLEYAQAGDVQVSLGSAYVTKDDVYFYTIGTVQNHTNCPISGQIRIEYMDASGQSLGVTVFGEEGAYDDTGFFAPIGPGETGYFDRIRDIGKLSKRPARARVSLEYAVLEKTSPIARFSQVQWEHKENYLTLVGKIENIGNVSCRMPTVVAVLFQNGIPVAAESRALEQDELHPGESQEFSLEMITDFLPAFNDLKLVMDCSPLTFER